MALTVAEAEAQLERMVAALADVFPRGARHAISGEGYLWNTRFDVPGTAGRTEIRRIRVFVGRDGLERMNTMTSRQIVDLNDAIKRVVEARLANELPAAFAQRDEGTEGKPFQVDLRYMIADAPAGD